ncbi:MAG: YARHG domain-containing protein, partial [Bacteroidales bacterium]|nr:YARHG domain-containing protein [Bacteroidales bacterium]
LIFSSSRIGRFNFASSILLDPYTLRQYNRQLLRYMRNEILARHGYRFQSKELNDYFTNQSWYKPAENNDDIQLTFLEELNVATIKFAESEKGQD